MLTISILSQCGSPISFLMIATRKMDSLRKLQVSVSISTNGHQSVRLFVLSKPIRLIRSLPFTNVNRINDETQRRVTFLVPTTRGNSILVDGSLCQKIFRKLFLAIFRSETYRANKTNFSIFFDFIFPI